MTKGLVVSDDKAQRSMVKAVIFDVDGTLLDSNDQHALAWADAFRANGYEFPLRDIRRQIGKGGDQLMPVFLSKAEMERDAKNVESACAEIFKTHYLPSIVGFPGVRALFERLRSDNKRLALASSAKAEELQHYKHIANISDLVDRETTSDDAESSKPEPDIFQATLRRLKIASPQDVLVVGDTPYDSQGAAKAGLKTIGLLCGGWSEIELRQSGVIAVYRDPADLMAQYDESPLSMFN